MKIIIREISVEQVPYEGKKFKVDYEILDDYGTVKGKTSFAYKKESEDIKEYIFQKVTNSAIKKYKTSKKERDEQRELDSLKGMEIPAIYILARKLEGSK
jgi:hypothetical protein